MTFDQMFNVKRTAEMQIRVYETVTMRPNGDRDPGRHPCSSFDVVLVNGERKFCFFHIDQFNNFNCSIDGTRLSHLKHAMDAADAMARVIGTVEIVGIEVTKLEKEMMDLESSIKRDQIRLNELRRKVL